MFLSAGVSTLFLHVVFSSCCKCVNVTWQVTLLSSTKSRDCHWPLKVQLSEDAQEAVGIRGQDSLCVRHIIKSREATAASPLFLGCSMDKASVRGLDLMNAFVTTPQGFGMEAMPQMEHIIECDK